MRTSFLFITALALCSAVFCSCTGSPKSDVFTPEKSASENQTRGDEIKNKSEITAFQGKLAVHDISKTILLLDTLYYKSGPDLLIDTVISRDGSGKKATVSFDTVFYNSNSDLFIDTAFFNQIIGVSDNYVAGESCFCLFPMRNDKGELRGTYQYNDSTMLIPYHANGDGEITIYTIWIQRNKDTLKYKGYLKRALLSKYAYARIVEVLTRGQTVYFIGRTDSGEGGGVGKAIWLAKYNQKDNFSILDSYEVTYQEEDKVIPVLTYEVKKREIRILERRIQNKGNDKNASAGSITNKVVKIMPLPK